jgi:uncharacterized membrane protein YoaK (UPF0700 family)
MLGLLQTGLFFQLTSIFSSAIGTYLMVTLCWLIGSAVGVAYGSKLSLHPAILLPLALLSYAMCGLLLFSAPFQTELWPLYAGMVMIIGLYPGLFFACMVPVYRARVLFLLENNGFILGLVCGTLLILTISRTALWVAPVLVAAALYILREPQPFAAVI